MINRRQFLKTAGAGALGIMAGTGLFLDRVLAAGYPLTAAGTGFVPDLDIELTAMLGGIPIFTGSTTHVCLAL